MFQIRNLYNFLNKYNLIDFIDIISSSITFLQASFDGFTTEQWIKLTENNIREARDLASPLFSILVDLEYLSTSNNTQYYAESEKIINQFNNIQSYIELSSQFESKEKSKLLWNMNNELKMKLPLEFRTEFTELNSYFKNIISPAKKHVVFCAPYFSLAGIKVLNPSIQAALRSNDKLKFTFIIDAKDQSINKNFIDNLHKYIPPSNFNLYLPSTQLDGDLTFHSKFLVVDAQNGYLGSANFSDRALKNQFELGVKLSANDCANLEFLVEKWIELNYLSEVKE